MRQHIGFERLWAMQIPVPYSLFLRDGDFGWSCGQCPLDRAGQVIAPGDAIAQAGLVAQYAKTLLAEAGFSSEHLRMAVVYHDTPDPTAVLSLLREALGDRPLLVPVRVPAFYYPGMLIEVDLFTMAKTAHPLRFATGGPEILTQTPLIDHWIAGKPDVFLPRHALIQPSQNAPLVWAVFTPDPVIETEQTHGPTTVRLRQSGPWTALSAVAPHSAGLVAQTEVIMQAFSATLDRIGLSFRDVVKSTTHYVGAATPEELHDNMKVRNRRYSNPGPTSTGIRVVALADPAALTAITLLLCKT